MPRDNAHARIRLFEDLFHLSSLVVVNNYTSIEETDREQVLIYRTPGDAPTGTESLQRGVLLEYVLFSNELMDVDQLFCTGDREVALRIPVKMEHCAITTANLNRSDDSVSCKVDQLNFAS